VAGGTVSVAYSLLTGTASPYVIGSVNWGLGIVSSDPLFASATDVHEQSRAGRWNPATALWVNDPLVSPCIDAGDPADPVGLETPPPYAPMLIRRPCGGVSRWAWKRRRTGGGSTWARTAARPRRRIR
jgi:hypothetical protein